MNISVVIPSYQSGPKLPLLLRSLAQCELDAGDSLEAVVVDDGSTDGTGDLLAELSLPFPLHYLYLPRTPLSSRAAARNAAIAKASGDLIVMADADQVVEPGFIAEHARYHRLSTSLVVIGPRPALNGTAIDVEGLTRDFFTEVTPKVLHQESRTRVLAAFSENFNNLATGWHFAFTCNLSVRREHLLAAGGFDEGFLGWGLEDSELGYRLSRSGLAFAFNPAAVSYQDQRDITAEMFTDFQKNLDYFVDKHGRRADVAVQQIICRALGPERGLYWEEAAIRMEFAGRALAGRLPEPASYELIEVDDASSQAVAGRLPELAAGHDLLIIDNTSEAALRGPVQCITTARELVYFHCPSADARQRILTRYRTA